MSITRHVISVTTLLGILLVAGADAAGARQLFAVQVAATAPLPFGASPLAMAPGPAAQRPPADILFLLSAARAVLTADSLALVGVTPLVQSFTEASQTGVFSTADFANGSAGSRFVSASGQWLNQPVAVLKATSGDQPVSALVALAWPRYNASSQTLSFQAKLLPATAATQLPTIGGAATRLVDDAANGLAAGVLADVPTDAQLTAVGLFIDQHSMGLGSAAVTKWGGGGCGGGGCGGGSGRNWGGSGGRNWGGSGGWNGGGGWNRGGGSWGRWG